MSVKIDFDKPLTDFEKQYVKDRPWLVRDAELEGYNVEEILGDGDGEDSVVDYNEFTVEQLTAEIDSRNGERDEDEQIVPEGKKKADLVAALVADDESGDED